MRCQVGFIVAKHHQLRLNLNDRGKLDVMSSRGTGPNMNGEKWGWPSRRQSTEQITLPMSRKRPRGDGSPRDDGDNAADRRSRSFSLASDFRGVRDTYPTREHATTLGRYQVTMSPIKAEGEEFNSRDMSATVEAEFGCGYDGGNTGGSPQTLPASFGDALNRLHQELLNLDPLFLFRFRPDAIRHVDDIKGQLKIMEDLHSSQYSDLCSHRDRNEELQDRLSQLKDQIMQANQEREQANRETEEQKRTIARLKTSMKDFEGAKAELNSRIKDLEDRNRSLEAEKEKLEATVEAKNAEIEALKTSPLSTATRAWIGHDASDSLPQSLLLSAPLAQTTPLVTDARDHRTHHSTTGWDAVASFLGSLLRIELPHDQPSGGKHLNPLLAEFMLNLGSSADAANVTVSPAERSWNLLQPWNSRAPFKLGSGQTIEERFVRLCLLIPHLKSQSRDDIWPQIVLLINALMKADYTSTPRPGMAFLAAMKSTSPLTEVKHFDIQHAAVAIALCELCRFLQETFTGLLHATWDIGNILGSEAQRSLKETSIGRLDACLANLHRPGTLALRRELANTCGDKFCFVSQNRQSGDKWDLGFLSCDDKEFFMVLDFGKKQIRFVDRKFAYAIYQEDRKKHLLVKRPCGKVLLDLEDVAQDVRIFWVKYAEHP